MDQRKIEIAFKLEELDEMLNNGEVMLEEYDYISQIVNRSKEILNGKIDKLNFDVKDDQMDQCINALNNLISKFKIRTK